MKNLDVSTTIIVVVCMVFLTSFVKNTDTIQSKKRGVQVSVIKLDKQLD